MDVGLAEVLVLEVFMWRVRVANCCVIVFVLMERAQVVEAAGVLVVVMGHVMVRMGVHQLSVLMFLWFTHRRPLPFVSAPDRHVNWRQYFPHRPSRNRVAAPGQVLARTPTAPQRCQTARFPCEA